MSFIEEVVGITKKLWEILKKIGLLLKKLIQLLIKILRFLKSFYDKVLKGKFVTIRGKQIPRTLIAVLILLFGCFAFILFGPKSNEVPNTYQSSDIVDKSSDTGDKTNTYDENGLKIYDLRKCEEVDSVGACGLLENYGDNNFAHVKITLTFHSASGEIVYEGGVEATDVESHTRLKINIPCPEEFVFFKLKSVDTDGMTAVE